MMVVSIERYTQCRAAPRRAAALREGQHGWCMAALRSNYPLTLEKVEPPPPLERDFGFAASSADMTCHLVMGGRGVVGLARQSSAHSSSPTNQSEFFGSGVAL